MVEPWLRGTHTKLPAVPRQILHALELTTEDHQRWCSALTAAELEATPYGLPSVAFQMRHIVRSLDRLLTYAEGHQLTSTQLDALRSEHQPSPREALEAEFRSGLTSATTRILAFHPTDFEAARHVGRDRLPTTLAGLLIHCAEHTQRHSGQMVTTAKLILALRSNVRPAF
jgi:uncharacterized damage-inducible protein DinB